MEPRPGACLMFTIREVPQASTGFSPFEMMYGWNHRGILDLVKDKWDSGKDAQIVVQQVIEMQDHLNKVAEVGRTQLQKVQG